jgi:lysophospholipase L1-like esterase
LAAVVGSAGLARAGFGSRRKQPESKAPIEWHDVSTWGVEGKGFEKTLRFFDRLPGDAKGSVPKAVWDLSRHSAGMAAHFESDATAIHLRYTLLLDRLEMAHMPATGVSGMDLYGLDGTTWRWAAVFAPSKKDCEGPLIEGMDKGTRRWRLYLPLYNGVDKLEIGVPAGSSFISTPPRAAKPVAFYGTSILHGACASRPGMSWPSIVGRRLDLPIVNLGFSGSGKMEPSVAKCVSQIDAAAYVIDCAPNMKPQEITERAAPLVEMIKSEHPQAPIVLVEDRRYSYGWVKKAQRSRNDQNAKALRAVFDGLVARGVTGLEYVESGKLLGPDGQDSLTDGSHPNDHGMLAYADALTPVLAKALGRAVTP